MAIKTTALSLLLLLALLPSLTGCARSPVIQYYQLVPPETGKSDHNFPAGIDMVLGLGPVHLPEYLDQPKIVSRLSPNRLLLADSHRWAEPLADNFTSVLQQELATQLHPKLIVTFPWPLSQEVDCQLLVNVLRFETENDRTASLQVNWMVRDRVGKLLQPEKQESYRSEIPAHDYPGRVKALNEVLDRFARDLAEKLRPLLQKADAS